MTGAIAFNKPKYEQRFAKLRDRNEDLSVLCSQIDASQLLAMGTSGVLVQRKALLDRFLVVHNTVQRLHEALRHA
jgi:hypothetical protein